MNYFNIIHSLISNNEINGNLIKKYIVETKDSKNGDFVLHCFPMAKELNKNVIELSSEIAKECNEKYNPFSKIEAQDGNVVFYLHREKFCEDYFNEMEDINFSNIQPEAEIIISESDKTYMLKSYEKANLLLDKVELKSFCGIKPNYQCLIDDNFILVKLLSKFETIIKNTDQKIIRKYFIDLCKKFNSFYKKNSKSSQANAQIVIAKTNLCMQFAKIIKYVLSVSLYKN